MCLYRIIIFMAKALFHIAVKLLKRDVRVVLGSATVLACLGLKAVFDSHSYAEPPIPHLYSLHSWMGLSAVALAVAQWILGKQIVVLKPSLLKTSLVEEPRIKT
jgi:hypothetical protein